MLKWKRATRDKISELEECEKFQRLQRTSLRLTSKFGEKRKKTYVIARKCKNSEFKVRILTKKIKRNFCIWVLILLLQNSHCPYCFPEYTNRIRKYCFEWTDPFNWHLINISHHWSRQNTCTELSSCMFILTCSWLRNLKKELIIGHSVASKAKMFPLQSSICGCHDREWKGSTGSFLALPINLKRQFTPKSAFRSCGDEVCGFQILICLASRYKTYLLDRIFIFQLFIITSHSTSFGVNCCFKRRRNCLQDGQTPMHSFDHLL